MTGAMPGTDEQPIKSGTLYFVNAKTCRQHLRYVIFVKEQHAVHGGVSYYLRTYKSQKDSQTQRLMKDEYKLTRERFCGIEKGYRIVEKQMGILTRTACMEEEEHMFIITRDYSIMIQHEDCRNSDGEDLESWSDVIKQEMGVKGSWPVSGTWNHWPKHVTLHLTEDYLTLVKHAPPTYLQYYRLEDLKQYSQIDNTHVSLRFASTLHHNDLKVKLEAHHVKSFLDLLSQHATLANHQKSTPTSTPKPERYTKVNLPVKPKIALKVPKVEICTQNGKESGGGATPTPKSPTKGQHSPQYKIPSRPPPTPPPEPILPPVPAPRTPQKEPDQQSHSSEDSDDDESDLYDINSLVRNFQSKWPMDDVYKYVNGNIRTSVDDQDYAFVRRMTQKSSNLLRETSLPETRSPPEVEESRLLRSGKLSNFSCEDLTSNTATEEIYWTNITRTLDQVLKNKPPKPDTLKLPYAVRTELCMRLYTMNPVEQGWQYLGDMIGLTNESLNLIDHFIQSQRIHECAAEIVLRHWQYTYNRGKLRNVPCTREQLMKFLEEMDRHDLVNIVQRISR